MMTVVKCRFWFNGPGEASVSYHFSKAAGSHLLCKHVGTTGLGKTQKVGPLLIEEGWENHLRYTFFFSHSRTHCSSCCIFLFKAVAKKEK